MIQNSGKKKPFKLKIVIILPTLDLGGAERQAIHLAKFFKENGAIVEILGFGRVGLAAELCKKLSIPCRYFDFRWTGKKSKNLKNLSSLFQFIKKLNPDILIPYTMSPNVACGLLWRFSGAKLCIWNQGDEGINRVGYKYEKIATLLTPKFISNSLTGKEFLIKEYALDKSKIHIIRNGIELEKPSNGRKLWREKLNISDKTFTACMVANIHENKDHLTLIYAWELVINELRNIEKNCVLLLAGYLSTTAKSIKATAFDLGLCNSVKFLGPVEDISGLLSSVDVGILSSKKEGCPNAILEYMASGLAVAATDISGIREAFGPEQYGFLSPPGDPEILAKNILKLYNNRELRKKLGKGNQSRIIKEFNLNRMCIETIKVIESSIA